MGRTSGGTSGSSGGGGVPSKQFKFKIRQEDLLCRNGCGHYGNEIQEGYCSLCFKAYKQTEALKQAKVNSQAGRGGQETMAGSSGVQQLFGSGLSGAFSTLPRAAAAKL